MSVSLCMSMTQIFDINNLLEERFISVHDFIEISPQLLGLMPLGRTL